MVSFVKHFDNAAEKYINDYNLNKNDLIIDIGSKQQQNILICCFWHLVTFCIPAVFCSEFLCLKLRRGRIL